MLGERPEKEDNRIMKNVSAPHQVPAQLARRLPPGCIRQGPNGKLRIEAREELMDEIMSEVNRAYYQGQISASDVEFVVSPAAKRKPIPSIAMLPVWTLLEHG